MDNYPWCATKVDENGNYVGGKNPDKTWRNPDKTYNLGVCEPDAEPKCPIPPRRKFMIRIIEKFIAIRL